MHGSPSSPTSVRSTHGHINPLTDENIGNEQTTPTSPRSAILLQNALQQQLPTDPPSASTVESHAREAHGTIERRRDGHPRSTRERRRRTSQQAELSLMNLSKLELDRLRSDSRPDSVQMRGLLETALRQVNLESKRAAELQRINEESAARFRILNENRLAAQQEAVKANTEMKLFQFQLDSAQKEIEKTRMALKEVEKQRDEAETAAARAREKARKYQQERLVAAAKEEGRKLGYEAGLNRAKKEREMLTARRSQPVHLQPPPPPAPPSTRKEKGKEREYYPEDRRRRPQHTRNHTGDDKQSSPDISPRLPVRNLPSMRSSKRPPTRVYRPRPESEEEAEEEEEEEEEEENGYESEREQQASRQPQEYPRAKTPSVYHWKVDVPAANKLDESFNSTENPNDAVPQGPRDAWVTAHQHRDIRGSPHVQGHSSRISQASTSQLQPPNRQGEQVVQPPPLLSSSSAPAPIIILPPRQELAPPPKPAPAIKSVKFWARRPSLAKTKQQASSWYRSLSFRKKTKPVIDPIAEEPTDTPSTNGTPGAMASGLQVSGSGDYPPLPPGALYGPRPQTSQSWYAKRTSMGPSVRSYDYAFARRQPSDVASVSTRVSQFDLLSTPALTANTNVMMGTGSVSGATRSKGKGHVKEKESHLSVIKEDSASRGNTPDRPLGYGVAGSESMQQDFGQHRGMQQRPSYGTMNGSVQNKRRLHRPPSIIVPDPEAPLQPAGVAYQKQGYLGTYPAGADLLRKSSIEIDIIPPSGNAPDAGSSPPHTGRNHLSPYHVFHHSESSRNAADRILDPPKTPTRPNSAAHGRSVSGGAPGGHDSPLQAPRLPFASTWGPGQDPSASGVSRPVSRTSRRQLRPATSTSTFKVVNPDPSSPSTPSPGASTRGRTAGQTYLRQSAFADVVAPASGNGSAAAFVLTPRRQASRTSLKSNKSYSKYNPDEYVDPAFWGVDGPGGPPAAAPAQPRPGMVVDDFGRATSRLSKRESVDSGLSYA